MQVEGRNVEMLAGQINLWHSPVSNAFFSFFFNLKREDLKLY